VRAANYHCDALTEPSDGRDLEQGYVPPVLPPLLFTSPLIAQKPLNAVTPGIFVFGAVNVLDSKIEPPLQPPGPFQSMHVSDDDRAAQALQETIRVLEVAREKNALAKGLGKGKGNVTVGDTWRCAASSSDLQETHVLEHYCLDDGDQSHSSSGSGGEFLRQLRREEAQRIADGGIEAVFTDSDEDKEGYSGSGIDEGPGSDEARGDHSGSESVSDDVGESRDGLLPGPRLEEDAEESERLFRMFYVEPKD